MIVKGYLFYKDGAVQGPIPSDFAQEYTDFNVLLNDLNDIIERNNITLSGYLLLVPDV